MISDETYGTNVPSVYSCAEIKRHEKRLKLKALEESSDYDSDNNTYDGDCDEDHDLDINLRIFEENAKSVSNVLIGEIQCDVMDDKCNKEENNDKLNKNTNIFKLSVNANFYENGDTENKTNTKKHKIADTSDSEEDIFSDLSSDFFFSGDDSDLEILTSKPIVRKRTSQPTIKEKTAENGKLTMYDLIHDTVSSTPRNKDEENETENKTNPRKKDSKKTKNEENYKLNETIRNKESLPSISESSNELPVPQLKVGADGQVVIDMDTLIIERTGVAEARDVIANSEIIEECGFNYKSYNKKCGYRKQWSPHDTLKFYDVLSAIGTDFSLMATLFPGRTRNCMKRKFKREEKTNSNLILKALTCKQKFDIGLLEKELKKKEERVNLLKKNSKKEKSKNKKEKEKKKETTKCKRRSFFERGISCFQNS